MHLKSLTVLLLLHFCVFTTPTFLGPNVQNLWALKQSLFSGGLPFAGSGGGRLIRFTPAFAFITASLTNRPINSTALRPPIGVGGVTIRPPAPLVTPARPPVAGVTTARPIGAPAPAPIGVTTRPPVAPVATQRPVVAPIAGGIQQQPLLIPGQLYPGYHHPYDGHLHIPYPALAGLPQGFGAFPAGAIPAGAYGQTGVGVGLPIGGIPGVTFAGAQVAAGGLGQFPHLGQMYFPGPVAPRPLLPIFPPRRPILAIGK